MLEKISHTSRLEFIDDDFHVNTLYPGDAFDKRTSAIGTIARIDHISLRPEASRPFYALENHDLLTYVINGELKMTHDGIEVMAKNEATHWVTNAAALRPNSAIVGRKNNQAPIEFLQIYFIPVATAGHPHSNCTQLSTERRGNEWRWLAGQHSGLPLTLSGGTRVYDIHLKAGEFTKLPVMSNFQQKSLMLYTLSGSVALNDHYLSLGKGDLLMAQDESPNILAREDAKLLLLVTDTKPNMARTVPASHQSAITTS